MVSVAYYSFGYEQIKPSQACYFVSSTELLLSKDLAYFMRDGYGGRGGRGAAREVKEVKEGGRLFD